MPAISLKAFYYGNTNRLHLTNARSQLSGGGVVSGAAGTAQLMDKDMVEISDAVALTTLTGPGEYEAIFPSDAPLTLGQFVNVLILLDGGPNLQYRGVVQARVVENLE